MNCREFQLLMKDFVCYNITDEDVLDKALEHIKTCRSCYEELELYYILTQGMEKIDRDETDSYDFTGELDEIIGRYCADLRICRGVQILNHCMTVFAFWVLSAFLVLQMLFWICEV